MRTDRRVVLFGALLLGWVALLVLVATRWDPLRSLDLDVAGDLHSVAVDHPGQASWWRVVSEVLHPDVERIVAAVAAVWLWRTDRVRIAIYVVVVMAGAAVLETIAKLGVGRARPELVDPVAHAAGKSFPSGHALTAFVAFALLVLLVPRRFKVPAAIAGGVAVLLVTYSRLALGVHYLSDVIGGWLLGAAWLVLADLVLGGRLRDVDRQRSPAATGSSGRAEPR